MRIIKPNWVKHSNEKGQRSEIYSVSVHPDGTRLATGGKGKSSSAFTIPTYHHRTCLVAHDLLADGKVKIWSTVPILDEEAEVDEGNPKLLCTMTEHAGAVLNVRWAHHGRFLASGSDDKIVMIWGIDPHGGGGNFGSSVVNVEHWKPLTRLVGHSADVIDVAWSRDDSMLASVGLDKIICIWDGETFDRLRRLDLHSDFVKGVTWDPVGNFLATQSDDKTVRVWDATTWSVVQSVEKPFENSPKSTFFRRLSWSPDGAFIAASNAMNGPVFVAAVIDREGWSSDISFVGHANTIQVAAFNPRLFFSANDAPARMTASCMLALGADDFSISIWRNTLHKPLVVLHDVFNRSIYDLCWANDGHTLYGCSEDGTICVVSFKKGEMHFAEIGDLQDTETVLNEFGFRPPPRALRPTPSAAPVSSLATASVPGRENVLAVKRGTKGKKRALLNSGATMNGDAFAPPIVSTNGTDARAQMMQGMTGAAGAFGGIMDAGPSRTLKRKAGDLDDLAGPSARMARLSQVDQASGLWSLGEARMDKSFAVPPVTPKLSVDIPSGSFNGTNEGDAGSRVALVRGSNVEWTDQLPQAILALAATETYAAVGCDGGLLAVYGLGGRTIFLSKLDSPVIRLVCSRGYLGIMTSRGQVRVYDITQKRAIITSSIPHLCELPHRADIRISSFMLNFNGVPIVVTSEPAAYAYSSTLEDWMLVSASWWSRGANEPMPDGGVVAQIEGLVDAQRAASMDVSVEAMSMGQWDTRLQAAVLLDSKAELKYVVERYTQLLTSQGLAERAQGLLEDLSHQAARSTGSDKEMLEVVIENALSTFAGAESMRALVRTYKARLGL